MRHLLRRLGAAGADAVTAALIAVAELVEARRQRRSGWRPPCPAGCSEDHLHMAPGQIYMAPLDTYQDINEEDQG